LWWDPQFNTTRKPPPRNAKKQAHLDGFHPFTLDDIQAQLLDKWKWPNIKAYNDYTDLETQVKASLT